jgi:hypothetical protein
VHEDLEQGHVTPFSGSAFAALILISSAARASSSPVVDRSSAVSTATAFFSNPTFRIGAVSQHDPYAVVSFRNGQIEGSIDDGQLLLQKFPFGWQVIDLSIHRFTTQDMASHGIAAAAAQALLHGLVPGKAQAGWELGDYGPAADVDDISRTMVDSPGEAIGAVKVYSGYAVLLWFGRGGGERVFAKRNGGWVPITGGGGCLDTAGFVHYGVSAEAAARFAQWFPCGPR